MVCGFDLRESFIPLTQHKSFARRFSEIIFWHFRLAISHIIVRRTKCNRQPSVHISSEQTTHYYHLVRITKSTYYIPCTCDKQSTAERENEERWGESEMERLSVGLEICMLLNTGTLKTCQWEMLAILSSGKYPQRVNDHYMNLHQIKICVGKFSCINITSK